MSAAPIDPKCQRVVELVNEYLGHVLTAEERIAFEKHLYTCPPCTTYLAQMKTVVNVAGSLRNVAAPDKVEQELMTLFQGWCNRSPR